MIGTIDIRGGLTVSRWLLTEQVWLTVLHDNLAHSIIVLIKDMKSYPAIHFTDESRLFSKAYFHYSVRIFHKNKFS